MPNKDPLDQIMNTLRSSKSIDPASASIRKSRMQQSKTKMGIGQGQTGQLKKPIMPAKQPIQPNFQTPAEFGGAGADQAQEMGLVSTLIDQLNEAILSIKVQVDRERNPQTQQMLAEKADVLRQQIVELGGTPIMADESVEQGVSKLKGKGYIGRDQLNLNMGLDYGPYTKTTTPTKNTVAPTAPNTTTTATRSTSISPLIAPIGQSSSANRPVMDAANQPPESRATVPTPTPSGSLEKTLSGIGATKASTGTVSTKTPAQTYTYTPPKTDGVGAVSIMDAITNMFGSNDVIRATFDAKTGEVVISGPSGESRIMPTSTVDGVTFANESDIVDAAIKAGAVEAVMMPGAPVIIDGKVIQQPSYIEPTLEDVKEFMSGLGLSIDERMTEEEYMEMRTLEAKRGFLQSIGGWQASIEKFKNDSENEYRIAERKIMKQAATMKGQAQEEFASRGMYYTSIMAGAMAQVDTETMNIMGDIAIEAANKVAEMGMEVTRLEELMALEESITQGTSRLEYQDRSERLVEIGMNVHTQLVNTALSTFNTEWASYTWSHQQQIVAWQAQEAKYKQEQNDIGLVQWALGDPYVAAELKKHGALGTVRNSSPEEAARLVSNIINVSIPMLHNQEAHDMQLALQASQISLNRAQASQARAYASAAGREAAAPTAAYSPEYTMGIISEFNKLDTTTEAGKREAIPLATALWQQYNAADSGNRGALTNTGWDYSSQDSLYRSMTAPKEIAKKPSFLTSLFSSNKPTTNANTSLDKADPYLNR